ncbi:MAG: hypothetical protein HZC41_03675 [Chloroflexi bacterium]|nr:hypothetical protein [Chloroflexota bacterium]
MSADVPETRGGSAAEMEYATLREEMLKRIDSRQQTISITLTLAGAFLGFGWGAGNVVILLYPLIALLLAVGWAQNEVFIKQLSAYIRDRLESQRTGLGWETYSRQRMSEIRFRGWPIEVLAIGGIFVLSQVMAIGLATLRFNGTLIEWILLLLDIGAIILMATLVEYLRRRSIE